MNSNCSNKPAHGFTQQTHTGSQKHHTNTKAKTLSSLQPFNAILQHGGWQQLNVDPKSFNRNSTRKSQSPLCQQTKQMATTTTKRNPTQFIRHTTSHCPLHSLTKKYRKNKQHQCTLTLNPANKHWERTQQHPLTIHNNFEISSKTLLIQHNHNALSWQALT